MRLPVLQVEKGMQGIDTRVTNPKGKGGRPSTSKPPAVLQPSAHQECGMQASKPL